ncbi:MAG: hypothetical protein MR639_07855 [Clostridium sp.]|uniref:hypothetical protein n=1 Tax=Clostridium sp. TaxID=1506 RepID=UPI002A8EE93D|nr:hypothetical protein [Clostridium sp.]MDY5099645.1 hypothetical protein [Clostridium sp.]
MRYNNTCKKSISLKSLMKDSLTTLCWISVTFTIIVLISVFLSTHNIIYIRLLNNYYALQISMSITFFLWSAKFFTYGKNKTSKFTYSFICLLLSIGSLCFTMLNVY